MMNFNCFNYSREEPKRIFPLSVSTEIPAARQWAEKVKPEVTWTEMITTRQRH